MIGYEIKNKQDKSFSGKFQSDAKRYLIRVNGIVQGVGFRPFIFNLAQQFGLDGFITNTSAGVVIEVQGAENALKAFIAAIQDKAPPLSEIISLQSEEIPARAETAFRIVLSQNSFDNQTLISPDVSICDQCLQELFDPSDRRYRYPFINCTNCGPRYTIIKNIPYDRAQTSMAAFAMCPSCDEEYNNPHDRRFHAQPNACAECGPHLWYEQAEKAEPIKGDEASIVQAAKDLMAGRIVAVKGLGGFHLAVDATNGPAAAKLRQRKNRYQKPLALMVFDVDAARRIVHVTPAAEKLLISPQRPIVLLYKKEHIPVADEVAPGNRRLGIMLPYTPLHYLLLDQMQKMAPGQPVILVMTSANLSDEPIAIKNEDARSRLARIADSFVMHNRDILIRADDSVVFLNDDKPHFLRRSRGYAPRPVFIKRSGAPVLAVGGQLKNTICLLKEDKAFLSQHIGDLETYSAFEAFKQTVAHLQNIFETKPQVIACDMHPGYSATQWALEQPQKQIIKVQHHHAHLASVMAEWQLEEPVIGLILDGAGYGYDGTIWGGEILTGDYTNIRRAAWLEPVPLPGGEAAIKHPWRMALSYLRHTFGDELRDLPFLNRVNASTVQMMLDKNLNCPLTSSCGRLFDGVAAMSGGRLSVAYEAQAAIEMTQAVQDLQAPPYDFAAQLEAVPLRPIIRGVAEDVLAGHSFAHIAARFHQTLIALFNALIEIVSARTGLRRVVLSGGVFQNEILLAEMDKTLTAHGFEVITQRQAPANDGGLSLGQAAVAQSLLFHEQQEVKYSQGI